MTRFGFFGPSNDHDVPPGGFCISVFALIRKGEAVLVLKPKKDPRWEQEWSPNWRIYEPEHLEREMASWRLPSSYVKEGESPATALDRVMRDQMGNKGLRSEFIISGELLRGEQKISGEDTLGLLLCILCLRQRRSQGATMDRGYRISEPDGDQGSVRERARRAALSSWAFLISGWRSSALDL